MSKGKEILIGIALFIVVIQFGFLTTEYFKILVAQLYGFSYEYRSILGLSMFYSETDVAEPLYTQQLRNVEISGLFYTHFISLIGFIALFTRRKTLFTNQPLMDILFVILSLFFMRDVIYPGIFMLFKYMPCQIYSIYNGFFISGFTLVRIHLILGLSLSMGIIWMLPSNNRFSFFLMGILGTLIGLYIALRFTSQLL